MRTFVVCALAALCVAQASAYGTTDQLLNQLNTLKLSAAASVQDLTHLQNEAIFTSQQRASDALVDATLKLDSSARTVQKYLQKLRKDAWITVQHCLDSVMKKYDGDTHSARSELRTCQENALEAVDASALKISSALAYSMKVYEDLDNAPETCYSSNTIKYQSCLARTVREGHAWNKKVLSQTAVARSSVNASIDNVVKRAETCFATTFKHFKTVSDSTTVLGDRCLLLR